VIGHDIEGLRDEPGLLHLDARCGHGVGLARADGVRQQGVAATHDAPHGGFLVGLEGDGLVHAGEGEV